MRTSIMRKLMALLEVGKITAGGDGSGEFFSSLQSPFSISLKKLGGAGVK